MRGLRQSKHEYLNAVKDGTLNYFSEETDNIKISINNNAAVFGGGRHTWRLELEIELINKYG